MLCEVVHTFLFSFTYLLSSCCQNISRKTPTRFPSMGVNHVFSSNPISTGLSEKLDFVLTGKICHLGVHSGNDRQCSCFREKKEALHSPTQCKDLSPYGRPQRHYSKLLCLTLAFSLFITKENLSNQVTLNVL